MLVNNGLCVRQPPRFFFPYAYGYVKVGVEVEILKVAFKFFNL